MAQGGFVQLRFLPELLNPPYPEQKYHYIKAGPEDPVVGKVPVFGFPKDHNAEGDNAKHIYAVHDDHTHRDEPQLMLPRAGKKHKQHQNLIKLLQTRTALVDLDVAAVGKPHDVRGFDGDMHTEEVAVDPQTRVENAVGEPVGGDVDRAKGLDDAGEVPPQTVKKDGDDSKKHNVNQKAVRAVVDIF